MKTTTLQLNMEKILTKSLLMIEAATEENGQVSAQRITELYNAECDQHNDVSQTEFALACTLAIGAITEQEDSNIRSLAAKNNIAYLLERVSG